VFDSLIDIIALRLKVATLDLAPSDINNWALIITSNLKLPADLYHSFPSMHHRAMTSITAVRLPLFIMAIVIQWI
jgi:hypothetical protein